MTSIYADLVDVPENSCSTNPADVELCVMAAGDISFTNLFSGFGNEDKGSTAETARRSRCGRSKYPDSSLGAVVGLKGCLQKKHLVNVHYLGKI